MVGPDLPYMRFAYDWSGISRYGFGRYERLEFAASPSHPPSVTAARGRYPAPNSADVIGYMTVGTSNRYPILSFSSTIFDNV